MTVEEISKRLDQRFRWLRSHASGSLPRQQTLQALIDWSYDLLNERERILFQQLSVFAGGWTLEAAEAIDLENETCADTLGSLVDQSLIVFGQDAGHKRYRMHETIRQFAAEKLSDMGKEIKETALEKHHAYFMELLASQGDALQGMNPRSAVKLIQTDLEDIRHAWQWGIANNRLTSLHQSVKALSDFYETVGLPDEGERLLTGALSLVENPSALPPPERLSLQVDILLGQSRLLIHQAKLEAALEQAERALALAENLNDPARLGRAYLLSGQAIARQGNANGSRTCLEAALVEARRADDFPLEGEVLRYLGTVLQDLDEREQGNSHLLQALQIMQRLGNRSQEQAILLYLGVSSIEALDYVTGRTYLEEALKLIQSTGNRPMEARIQNAVGFVNAALGELETALLYHERSRQISHEIGDPFQKSHACHNLCTVNRKLGRLELAEQWGREALLLAGQNDLADPAAYAWLHLGYVFGERGKLSQAEEAFIRSRDGWLTLERQALAMEAVAGLAGTKWKRDELTEALSLVEEVLDSLAQGPLEGVDEPIRIFLTCYRVLRRCEDGRADDLLEQAHTQVMTIADKISDPTIRATFLERVPANRELIQLWETREK
jgi:tetratricopeptide (TPR) repeat protein